MRILITGAAGFIGAHVMRSLARQEHDVYGVDNFLDNYSVQLKRDRVKALLTTEGLHVQDLDVADWMNLEVVFREFRPNSVLHLAARPGVREGLAAIESYSRSNLTGFLSVASLAVRFGVDRFIYASSSSVYGNHISSVLSESAIDLQPISIYGTTKLSNEYLARSVFSGSHVDHIGLRMFSVYGPWGRPDMLPWRLAESAVRGSVVPIFGDGSAQRDFTYISDVVDVATLLLERALEHSLEGTRILNVGGGSRVSVREALACIESLSESPISTQSLPPVVGDVSATCADTARLRAITNKETWVSFEDGMSRTLQWMLESNEGSVQDAWTSLARLDPRA